MKICTKCQIEKDISEFYKNKRALDGYNYSCKECDKLFYNKNKDIIKIKAKVYRELNIEKAKVYRKKYNSLSKEKKRLSNIKYRENNKDYIREYDRNYRTENKEKIKLYKKNYNILNKKKSNDISRSRYRTDILYRLKILIRSSIKRLLKKKELGSVDILGCSYDDFKRYLESKFETWMTWDNHGLYNGKLNYGWDIDHIVPLSSAKTEEELIKLNHYSNLRPLCSKINRYLKKDDSDFTLVF